MDGGAEAIFYGQNISIKRIFAVHSPSILVFVCERFQHALNDISQSCALFERHIERMLDILSGHLVVIYELMT